MKNVLKLVLFAALVTAGVWLWLAWFPGPEKIIRKHLAELAHDVSFSSGNLARLAGMQGMGGLFSTNTEINIDVPDHMQHTFMGRDEITQAALVLRSTMTGLNVKFPDVNVAIAPNKQSATADLTVEATVAGERDVIVQEMKFTFRKIDRQWLITRIETVRPLS